MAEAFFLTEIIMGQFLEIVHGSGQYRQACLLRNATLRIPLGLDLYDEDLESESVYRHFGVFDGEELIACLVIVPLESGKVQLKQMTVDEAFRGKGIGRLLMERVEECLVVSGVGEIRLHARETALGFYEQLGFVIEGERFLEVSILHRSMSKWIGSD